MTALDQLARVAAYADTLLRKAEPDAEAFVSAAAVGSDLAAILSAACTPTVGGRQVAMLELSFWGLRNVTEVGPRELGVMLASEMVSLYLDQGTSEVCFINDMRNAWQAVKNTRRALGAPAVDRSGG